MDGFGSAALEDAEILGRGCLCGYHGSDGAGLEISYVVFGLR